MREEREKERGVENMDEYEYGGNWKKANDG